MNNFDMKLLAVIKTQVKVRLNEGKTIAVSKAFTEKDFSNELGLNFNSPEIQSALKRLGLSGYIFITPGSDQVVAFDVVD